MKGEKLFIVILLCSLAIHSFAQGSDTRFHNVNIEHGLSHSLVADIVEDSLGFLWIGTQDGLNRYDGYDFRSYFKGNDDRTPSESWISLMYIDRFNQIWVSYTTGGFDRFDPFSETFHSYKEDFSVSGSISGDYLNTVALNRSSFFIEDHAGSLWIGTSKGLIRYNREEDNFEQAGQYTGSINYLEEDLEHQILIGTNSGMMRYDPKTGTLDRFMNNPESEEILGEVEITSIYVGPDSSIWVGTKQGGLVIVENAYGDQYRISSLMDTPINPELDPSIYNIFRTSIGQMLVGTLQGLYLLTKKQDRYTAQIYPETRGIIIHFIHEDDRGNIWIASDTRVEQTLFRMGPDLKELEAFSYDEHDPFSFSGGMVQVLHSSRTGLLWIGTEKDGIFSVDTNAKRFKTINTNPERKLHLSNSEVYSIYEDSRQQLYVGTKTELNRINLKDGTIRNYKNDYNIKRGITYGYSDSYFADHVGVIREAGDGRIWLGSFDYKVGLYDPEKESYLNFHYNPDDASSYHSWSTRSICVTENGQTYFGGTSPGLMQLNEDGHSFSYFPVVESGDPSGTNDVHIQYLFEDSEAILWIGTLTGGLNRFDSESGEFIHYTHSPSDSSSISDNTVKCILEPEIYEEGQVLWIGTNSGLNKFIKDSRTFTSYSIGEGPANTIHGILEDKIGRLWMSTNRGLVEFDPQTESIKRYSSEDGLQGDEFNEGAFFKNSEGVMYFGGTNGITYFQPDEIEDFSISAPVVITSLRLSGEPVFPFDTINDHVILEKSIQYSDEIQLTHKDRSVSFEFTSPIFSSPKKLRYRYMLDDVQERWYEVDSRQRFINYTNLPPGEYEFLVSASNSEGAWSEDPTSLSVTILPPFWKTIWFYLILAGMVLIIFLTILQLRTSRLKKQKKVLEKEVEQRTSDLKETNKQLEVQKDEVQVMADKLHESDQMKLKFFTNISHEFRTPLTLIMGPTEKLIRQEGYEDRSRVKQELELIYRNEKRLFKLINQLLEIRKVETGNLDLSVSEGDIVGYLRQIHQLFMPYAEQKNIDFQFQSGSAELMVYFDADKIEKIFYNLLSNAFKHTPEYGSILMTAYIDDSQDNQRLKISVEDNGPGIAKEHLANVFNRFYQISNKYRSGKISSGIGLSLSRDLVEKHHGEIKVVSELEVGTIFEVYLKLDKDVYSDEEIAGPRKSGEQSMDYVSDMIDSTDGISTEEVGEQGGTEDRFCVLVVEDNLEMQKYLYDELSEIYQVSLAQNGSEGLDMAQESLPDLVLSDVMMPEMDGMELCKRIKNNELTSHLPVILLTAKTSTESQLSGLVLGADDYITKPFHAESLKLKIRNILAGRQQLVEKFSKDSNYIPESIKVSPIDQGFLEKFVKIVEDNVDNTELSGDLLACELGMSKGNLYKKLKSVSGMTVNIFVRTIRLKLAARLLKQGSYNISEVAYAVGFNNPKYFSTCFSELYSMSPKEYMK